MSVLENLIIKESKSSAVFVFPSEAAAAGCRKTFLKITGKTAVRSCRFLSWDRFKEQITLHNKEDKPVNSVIRRMYADDIVRRNRKEDIFSVLVPEEYRSQSAAFSETVYRILPELERLAKAVESSADVFAAGFRADCSRLYHEYVRFMKENGLFEPSWELPDLKDFKGIYYIICPEIIEDFDEFELPLKKAGCRFVPAAEGSGAELRQFENTVVETDTVLNEISELLHSGVHFSELAVTAADDDTAEILLEKARLRGIEMIRRSGKPLGEYPAGRLPELMRACRSSGFSLAAMKNLLLYRAFVWKEAETAAELIRFGIENRCLKNVTAGPQGDEWAKRIKSVRTIDNEKRSELLRFYRKLKAGIESICRAGDFAGLSKEFQVFISTFLETETELWDAGCEQVFQRTREVLSSLRDAEEKLQGVSVSDPLGFWIDSLNEKIYVPQQSGGIPVYPYRVSALINPRCHFVIGLSHDSSAAVSVSFPFLTDQQRQSLGAAENNMTDAFIGVYAGSGETVRFSCSADTPSGAALPPGYFIERGKIRRVKVSSGDEAFFADPVQAENRWWARACSADFRISEAGELPLLSAVQLAGFGYATDSFMTEKGFDAAAQPFPESFASKSLLPGLCDDGDDGEADAAGGLADGENTSGEELGFFRVSATALDSWSDCRFTVLLKYIIRIYEDEYILRAEDPWTAGSIMHDVLFRFFDALREAGTSFRFAGRLEEYQQLIRASADIVFTEYERSGSSFFGPAWDAFKRRALNDLLKFPAAEAEYCDGLSPKLLEDWLDLKLEDEQIHVTGRIDRISEGEDGAVIVDYKRKWDKQGTGRYFSEDENGELLPPQKGYQLPIYILLARANGMKVAGTSYYSITTAVHRPVSGAGGVLSEEETERLCELTGREIRRMAASCRAGDFTAAERCDGCGYRAVCRRRFNVRWS